MRSTSSRIGSTTSWRMNSKLRLPSRCMMLARLPLKKLSRQMTSWPSLSRRSHRWEPRNPAPPVTSARTVVPPGSAAVFAGDRENGFDYVVDIFVAHRGVDGKRQAAAEDVFGNRKIAVTVAVVALIVVHRVQRDAVHGASHAALAQYLDELVAAELEPLGP